MSSRFQSGFRLLRFAPSSAATTRRTSRLASSCPAAKKTRSYTNLWKELRKDKIALALLPLAMTALEFPLSSIAAERAYAIVQSTYRPAAHRRGRRSHARYTFASPRRLHWTRARPRVCRLQSLDGVAHLVLGEGGLRWWSFSDGGVGVLFVWFVCVSIPD